MNDKTDSVIRVTEATRLLVEKHRKMREKQGVRMTLGSALGELVNIATKATEK